MPSYTIVFIIIAYFFVLFGISRITGRKANNLSFFLGNRKSPWFIVAFGMLGASMSGITFISIPGWVQESHFSYMQVLIGSLLGYFIVANILLPLYYRLNLTSIYSYIQSRLGFWSYKTSALLFFISKLIGASFRLFLTANVLQYTVFDAWRVPFWATVTITILIIWLYTFKGGIKTIIWTDFLQTILILFSVGFTIYYISKSMGLNIKSMINTIHESSFSKTFFFNDWRSEKYFFKQFFFGVFIVIAMTGLDQDMMQKNLSCRNIHEAKKNMYWYSIIHVPVILLFLSLGVLLYLFATQNNIPYPPQPDDLFPNIAMQGYLGLMGNILFILGLIAATYSSADSALTALSTSFTLDILNPKGKGELGLKRLRVKVHIFISVLLLLVILIFKIINDQSVVEAMFTFAGYTYGPLLGLYSFGLFTKFSVKDKFVPIVASASPIICIILNYFSEEWLWGYKFGFEILILNGLITFLGLYILRIKNLIAKTH